MREIKDYNNISMNPNSYSSGKIGDVQMMTK